MQESKGISIQHWLGGGSVSPVELRVVCCAVKSFCFLSQYSIFPVPQRHCLYLSSCVCTHIFLVYGCAHFGRIHIGGHYQKISSSKTKIIKAEAHLAGQRTAEDQIKRKDGQMSYWTVLSKHLIPVLLQATNHKCAVAFISLNYHNKVQLLGWLKQENLFLS